MHEEKPTPQEAWGEACRKAEEYVKAAAFEDAGDMAIEVAHELLAIAHRLKGVACSACNGRGTVAYGDTSTWKRAIGGQQLTGDVCERCWGTGRADKSGPDLRLIKRTEQKEHEIAHLRAAQEKSWSAADEALLAEHDIEMARVCLVVEQFCRQCEYGDQPGSCSDCLLESISGGKR